ncbi:MAG: UDP-N-acetylglucosamine 2-epimerase (non-hydrolyzing) [Fimbriimonas sp.]|nr:UDP-N-acetylglucosamine 2-epimerase (non-hydrolyzing) [Fimbriimonas sp.]
MKVVTMLGTRPELIRLCLIIKKLDQLCDQVLIHTGQNYDVNLNDVFLQQLSIRPMNHYLGATGSFGEQIGVILEKVEKILRQEKPDRFLVLGDTNSSMAAIVAKRLAIPVYHMEAGNRCYDDRVPEEVNRRIIDHSSDILMPYTERSRKNLLAEGIPGRRIYVTGNPIKEVLDYYEPQIDASSILEDLSLKVGEYFLVTLHREENVDKPERLAGFVTALNNIATTYGQPVIWSVHPRTAKRLAEQPDVKPHDLVKVSVPFGLFEFVKLEKNARVVLSDSGTVQEECAIFNVPSVTLRDVTERPETLEAGSNVLSGGNPDQIALAIRVVLAENSKWIPPVEYMVPEASTAVIKILLGHLHR